MSFHDGDLERESCPINVFPCFPVPFVNAVAPFLHNNRNVGGVALQEEGYLQCKVQHHCCCGR